MFDLASERVDPIHPVGPIVGPIYIDNFAAAGARGAQVRWGRAGRVW
jgi:hypothetical protein